MQFCSFYGGGNSVSNLLPFQLAGLMGLCTSFNSPVGVHDCITFSLSVSLSSLQALSCFFQLSTLAEDSCSASTSLALFSLKVCSSVSHFLALVLLSDRRGRGRERDSGRWLLMEEKFRQVSVEMPGACAH